jgi:hypothetical protein
MFGTMVPSLNGGCYGTFSNPFESASGLVQPATGDYLSMKYPKVWLFAGPSTITANRVIPSDDQHSPRENPRKADVSHASEKAALFSLLLASTSGRSRGALSSRHCARSFFSFGNGFRIAARALPRQNEVRIVHILEMQPSAGLHLATF